MDANLHLPTLAVLHRAQNERYRATRSFAVTDVLQTILVLSVDYQHITDDVDNLTQDASASSPSC